MLRARTPYGRWPHILIIATFVALTLASCGRVRERAEARRSARGQSNPASVAAPANSIRVDGADRTYEFFAPAEAADGPRALMVLLHGGLGSAGAIQNTTAMDQLAKRAGFYLAIPNGTSISRRQADRHTWNAGTCCGPAQKKNVDDVAFISALVRDIAARHPIDMNRVYATGFSNGGMLAYRLACELPEVFAAVMPVSGAALITDCAQGSDVAVFAIHGDADANVAYEGGKGKFVETIYPSVATSIERVTRDRTCGKPTEKKDGKDRVTTYSCSGGSMVKLRTITGGGHQWPDGSSSFEGFSASEAIWAFAQENHK